MSESKKLRSADSSLWSEACDGLRVSKDGNVWIRLKLEVDLAQEIWKRIEEKYKHLTKLHKWAPLNNYVRDLILRDCGIDIAKTVHNKHDPLCDELVIGELIEQNPGRFDEKQKFWLWCRAKGMGATEIVQRSLLENSEWRGCSQQNIDQFLERVRWDMGIEL